MVNAAILSTFFFFFTKALVMSPTNGSHIQNLQSLELPLSISGDLF